MDGDLFRQTEVGQTLSVRSVPRCANRIVSVACEAVRPLKTVVRFSGSPAARVMAP